MELFYEGEEREDNPLKDKYLTFVLGKLRFGVALQNVLEVLPVQPAIRLPGMPSYFKGLIELRGSVMPLLDLRLRCGMEEAAYREKSCVVLIDTPQCTVGVLADEAADVETIPPEAMASPSEEVQQTLRGCIAGVSGDGSDQRLYLDLDRLIA